MTWIDGGTSFLDEPHKKGNTEGRMKRRRRLIEVITRELAQYSGSRR
jgi:hypothetical protein